MGTDVVQAMITRRGNLFIAEASAPAARCEAESIEAALAGLEEALRDLRSSDEKFYLLTSLYLGPIVEGV